MGPIWSTYRTSDDTYRKADEGVRSPLEWSHLENPPALAPHHQDIPSSYGSPGVSEIASIRLRNREQDTASNLSQSEEKRRRDFQRPELKITDVSLRSHRSRQEMTTRLSMTTCYLQMLGDVVQHEIVSKRGESRHALQLGIHDENIATKMSTRARQPIKSLRIHSYPHLTPTSSHPQTRD